MTTEKMAELLGPARATYRRHLVVMVALVAGIPGLMAILDVLAGKPSSILAYAAVLGACLALAGPWILWQRQRVLVATALLSEGTESTAETAGTFRTRRGHMLAVVLPDGARTLVMDPGTRELEPGSPIQVLTLRRFPRWLGVLTSGGALSIGRLRHAGTSRGVTSGTT
jgi:hypothetical protein